MVKYDLEDRTKAFALKIVTFVSTLQSNQIAGVLGRQLLRSGTSIGANYREANRAESYKDFRHKIAIVIKEASETQYWLDLLKESNLGSKETVLELHAECSQLLAIFTSIRHSRKKDN